MQFAQRTVKLEAGAANAVRGTVRGADICEYTEAMKSSWDGSAVQLSAGHLNAGLEFLGNEGFVLYRENWSQRLHAIGTLRPGMLAFGIPAGTGADGRWWGRPLREGRLPFTRVNCELDLVTGAGEAVTVLMMAEEEFHRIFHRLTGLDPTCFLLGGHFLAARPGAPSRLLSTWNNLLAKSNRHETSAVGIADLVAAVVDTMELPGRVFRTRTRSSEVIERVRHVARQDDYKSTVPRLSLNLGISRRSIEYAFREHLGISPHAYFTMRRLDLCKSRLTEADPKSTRVTDTWPWITASMNWGGLLPSTAASSASFHPNRCADRSIVAPLEVLRFSPEQFRSPRVPSSA